MAHSQRTVDRASRKKARGGVTVAQAVKAAATTRKRVAVPDKRVAVIPLADLRLLRRLEREAEDREDRAAVDASDANPEPSIPLEQVRARLGL